MELILDDDDHMQFYPALGDVEEAVLYVVSAVESTMQRVPTVQVYLLLKADLQSYLLILRTNKWNNNDWNHMGIKLQ